MIETRLGSIRSMYGHLGDIKAWVEGVVDGNCKVSPKILQAITKILSELPFLKSSNVSDEENILLTKAINAKTNEEMLAMLVSSTAKSIVALHELIDNKLELQRPEAIAKHSESTSLYGGNLYI